MKAKEQQSKIVSLLASVLIAIVCSAVAFGIFWHQSGAILLENSNSDHGDTLEEVVMRLIDIDYEVLVIFDANGQKLLEWTSGDEANVETPALWFQLAKLRTFRVIVLHNHPYDAPFSCTDLIMASQTRCECQMIVGAHALYTLEAPHGWPEEEVARNFLQEMIFNNPEQAMAQGYADVVGSRYYTTPEFIELYAEKFGLTFSMQPLNC